jgi:hypothetical protein
LNSAPDLVELPPILLDLPASWSRFNSILSYRLSVEIHLTTHTRSINTATIIHSFALVTTSAAAPSVSCLLYLPSAAGN